MKIKCDNCGYETETKGPSMGIIGDEEYYGNHSCANGAMGTFFKSPQPKEEPMGNNNECVQMYDIDCDECRVKNCGLRLMEYRQPKEWEEMGIEKRIWEDKLRERIWACKYLEISVNDLMKYIFNILQEERDEVIRKFATGEFIKSDIAKKFEKEIKRADISKEQTIDEIKEYLNDSSK